MTDYEKSFKLEKSVRPEIFIPREALQIFLPGFSYQQQARFDLSILNTHSCSNIDLTSKGHQRSAVMVSNESSYMISY